MKIQTTIQKLRLTQWFLLVGLAGWMMTTPVWAQGNIPYTQVFPNIDAFPETPVETPTETPAETPTETPTPTPTFTINGWLILSGIVSSDNHAPIGNAKVSLDSYSTTTSVDGFFNFDIRVGVDPITLSLVVEAAGYERFETQIEFVNGSSNTQVKNIVLTPLSEETPTETPIETPVETPTLTPTATPTITPTQKPSVETPTETPTETPIETPVETPVTTPTPVPTESPTPTPTVTPTATPIPYVLGDANLNGKLDIGDALAIAQYLAKLRDTIPGLDRADINENGRVDIGDALYIQQVMSGLRQLPDRPRQ